MPQPDFFNINPDIPQKISIEEKFANERVEWQTKINNMTAKMKKVITVAELMTEVYTERQICLEYYHYLITKMIKLNKLYRAKYSERHDYWTFKSQIRYPNESSKNTKILTEISELVEKREVIENHSKFMLETKNTIDNLIYAIPKRIEIEQISRGN